MKNIIITVLLIIGSSNFSFGQLIVPQTTLPSISILERQQQNLQELETIFKNRYVQDKDRIESYYRSFDTNSRIVIDGWHDVKALDIYKYGLDYLGEKDLKILVSGGRINEVFIDGWEEVELVSSYPINHCKSNIKIKVSGNAREFDIYFFEFMSLARNGSPPSKTGKVLAYGMREKLKKKKIFNIDLYINNEYIGLVKSHTNYIIDTDCSKIKNIDSFIYKVGRYPFKAVTRSGKKRGFIWTGTIDIRDYKCEILIFEYDN